MADVARAAGDHVVDAHDLGSIGEQAISEVGSEKASAAGHHRARRSPGHRTASRSGVLVPERGRAVAALGLRVGRPTPMYVKPISTRGSAFRQFRPSTTSRRRTKAATRVQSRPTYSGHSVTTTTASAPATH